MAHDLPRKLIGAKESQQFATEWNKIPDELDRLGYHHLHAEPPLELVGMPGGQLMRLTQFEIRRWAKLTTATYGGYSGSVSADLLEWNGTTWATASGAEQPLVYPVFAQGYFFADAEVEVRYNESNDRWYIVSPGESAIEGLLTTTLARSGTATVAAYEPSQTGGVGADTGYTATIVDAGQLPADSSPLDIGVRVTAVWIYPAWVLSGYDCDLEV